MIKCFDIELTNYYISFGSFTFSTLVVLEEDAAHLPQCSLFRMHLFSHNNYFVRFSSAKRIRANNPKLINATSWRVYSFQ